MYVHKGTWLNQLVSWEARWNKARIGKKRLILQLKADGWPPGYGRHFKNLTRTARQPATPPNQQADKFVSASFSTLPRKLLIVHKQRSQKRVINFGLFCKSIYCRGNFTCGPYQREGHCPHFLVAFATVEGPACANRATESSTVSLL